MSHWDYGLKWSQRAFCIETIWDGNNNNNNNSTMLSFWSPDKTFPPHKNTTGAHMSDFAFLVLESRIRSRLSSPLLRWVQKTRHSCECYITSRSFGVRLGQTSFFYLCECTDFFSCSLHWGTKGNPLISCSFAEHWLCFSTCVPLVVNHFQADELKGEAASKTGTLINAGAVWCGFKRKDYSHEASAKYTTPWLRLGGREPEDDRAEDF